MPNPGRVVEVRATQAGSGYLVTGSLVLTAWHVVRPKAGHPLPPVRVRVEQQIAPGAAPASAEQDAEVLWPLTDPGEDLDFALLRLTRPLAVPPVSWTPLSGFGKVSVQALGFPDIGIDRERNVRDIFPVDGWTFPAKWLRALKSGKGTFLIHLSQEDLPAGHPSEVWPGMSGAAVFLKDHLVGVIRGVGQGDLPGVLHALPVQRFFEHAPLVDAITYAGIILPAEASMLPLPLAPNVSTQRAVVSGMGNVVAQIHGHHSTIHLHVGEGSRERPYRFPDALNFELYIQHKRESFTGRDWLFKEIQQWLTSESGRRALLIRADYGVGKSAFLAEYVHRHKGEQVLAWHFCRHDYPETLQPGRFVRSIAAQLAEVIPAYQQAIHSSLELQKSLEEADSHPATALETAVLTPLADVPEPAEAQLLLVDALDESLEDSTRSGLVELLAGAVDYFPRWLRLLATSRPVPAVVDPLRAGFKPHEIVADDTPNLEDINQHVLGVASRKGILERLNAAGKTPEFLAGLLRSKSGGKFLFVVYALRELADGTLSIAMLDEMSPEGMDSFYLLSFRRPFGSKAEKYTEARAVLGVMCAAHEPLAPAELAQILAVSERQVLEVQEQIPAFIKLRAKGTQLSFDHFSLKEWLTRWQAEPKRPLAGSFTVHESDASSLIERWARERLTAGDAHTSRYLLRHLAEHITNAAERRSVYDRLLLDHFDWSQARLDDSSGVTGLLEDVKHLPRAVDAELLLPALIRQAEPALRYSRAQWVAQVLGRLGTGVGDISLQRLTAAAQRWASVPGRTDALLPLRGSLRWRAEAQRVGEGSFPLALLPDGRIAYAQGADVCVCDPNGRKELQMLKGHTNRITALAVLPDGRIVSGSHDRSVRVWSLDGGAHRVLEGHTRGVTVLAVLSDGRVVSGSQDRSVRVWSLDGVSTVLEGHTDWVTALAVLPDGRVISGGGDYSVRVWSLDGAAPSVREGPTRGVEALAVLADGRIVSGSWDDSVRVWSLDKASPSVLDSHTGRAAALAALPDGHVVSGDWDGRVRVWGLDGAPRVLAHHTGPVTALAVLPDGRVVSGSSDGSVQMLDLDGAARRVLADHTGWVHALTVLRDGRIAYADGANVYVCDPNGREEPRMLAGHTGPVTALAVLSDGRVVSGSGDGSVRVWDLDGAAPQVLARHTGWVHALAALPYRRIAYAHGADVCVCDPNGREAPRVLTAHTDQVNALSVLPDGRLVWGSADRSVRVWRLDGEAKLHSAFVADASVVNLTVTSSGVIGASCSDGTVHLLKVMR